jgi:copper transport protein
MAPSTRFRPPRAVAWAIVGLLVVLGGVVGVASPASAHAELLVSTPADGAIVDVAPDEVVLQFTEAVQLQPDGVRVVDADGDRVDLGEAVADGAKVTSPVEDDLAEGSYLVAWRVVSADGHPVRGAFTFSVGQASQLDDGLAASAFGSGSDRTLEVAAAGLRGLGYLGVLGSCGVVLVAARLRRREEPTPVQRWVTAGAVIGLASLVGQALLQAALVTGRGLGAITEPGVLELVLGDGFGLAAVIALIGLLAVLITSGLPFEGAARAIALTGAVVAPLSFALTGHTRTMEPAAVGYSAALVHLLAATVWFGGLGAVASTVRRRRRSGDVLGAAEAVADFSAMAAVAAGAVVVAGTVLSWIEVGGLGPLTGSTYGRLLLAKVAAVLGVLAVAAWNRFRLVPVVARDALADPGSGESVAWRRLSTLLRVELGVLAGVLVLTGVLVNVTPGKASLDRGPVTATAPLGEGEMEVTVDPASPGRNDVHIYLFDAQGRPDDRFDDATVRLELPEQGLGPLDRDPVRAGPGHFQLIGTDFTLSGTWTITVTVKPDPFTETTGMVEVDIE